MAQWSASPLRTLVVVTLAQYQQKHILVLSVTSDRTDEGKGGELPPGKLNVKLHGPPVADILIYHFFAVFNSLFFGDVFF